MTLSPYCGRSLSQATKVVTSFIHMHTDGAFLVNTSIIVTPDDHTSVFSNLPLSSAPNKSISSLNQEDKFSGMIEGYLVADNNGSSSTSAPILPLKASLQAHESVHLSLSMTILLTFVSSGKRKKGFPDKATAERKLALALS